MPIGEAWIMGADMLTTLVAPNIDVICLGSVRYNNTPLRHTIPNRSIYLLRLTQYSDLRISVNINTHTMDKNKDSGVSGGVKFVTSTLGNVTGGLARTVGEYRCPSCLALLSDHSRQSIITKTLPCTRNVESDSKQVA
jgi:hypothetical protein